jgi:sugar lactone lactonase YvrE
MKKYTLLSILSFLTYCLTGQNIITTVAGGGTTMTNGDGGYATDAQLGPLSVSFDNVGNMYIADLGNRIRKVDALGIITTVAGIYTGGVSGSYGGDGGPATSAQLYAPSSAIMSPAGVLYIADAGNNRIRKVDVNGIISTIAGTGVAGFSGDGGQATAAKISDPQDLHLDSLGNLYFVDLVNNCIRKINSSGIISTIAGIGGVNGYTGDGGLAIHATLSDPYNIAFDKHGAMYIADESNRCIRKVNTSGIISTIAGSANIYWGAGEGGPATSAFINYPAGLAIDKVGNLYVAEAYGNWVRKIDTSGIITTVAGTGVGGYTGDGGDALLAELGTVGGIAFDQAENLFIPAAYTGSSVKALVRKVTFCTNPLISHQPISDTICSGGNASFRVIACRATWFQWQVDTSMSGNHFVALSNNNTYLGATTSRLFITNATSVMNGYLYRCVVQDTVMVTSNTATLNVHAPQMNIIASSNTYCHSGSITLNAPAGLSYYLWTVGSYPSTDTLSMSSSAVYYPDTLSSGAIINLNIVDAYGCLENGYIQLNDSCGFVWPGDANVDLYANNYDLLPIGLYFGLNGPARSTISNAWHGYSCNNWSGTISNTPNPKFADCDGNGTVGYDDTTAIYNNFNLSHLQRLSNSQNITTSTNPDIYFQFSKNTYYPGDTLIADIMIGDNNNIQTNFYGAAFDIYYDPSYPVSGTEVFYFSNSWVGVINQDMITFSYPTYSSGSICASMVRINHQDVSGYGKVATLKFVVAGDTILSSDFSTAIYNPIKISSNGNTGQLTTGINIGKIVADQIKIYPNPSSSVLNVELNGKDESKMVYIINSYGQEINRITVNQAKFSVDISDISPGVYVLKTNLTAQKFIKE